MKKTEYKTWLGKFGLGFYSWLKVLPCYDAAGEPVTLKYAVPIVHFPIKDLAKLTARIKKSGFHFADSTLHYLAGYHIPDGHAMRALVKGIKEEISAKS